MKRIDLIKHRLVAWSSGICTLDETTTKIERMILEEQKRCAEIVKRHKNSPSIIYWNEACESIENEILSREA